jgi:4-azaleucine resistance transporter AzlC
MFGVTVLNHSYWVIATALGAVFGVVVHFNTEGLEYVMTALFIVIFVEQWLKGKSHASAIIGMVLSLISLLLFGADNFLIPAMLAIFLALIILRRPLKWDSKA